MKVILLDEIKGRGGEGDVVEVATGYAVNFLFPKKLAIQATKGNLKQLELRKHNIAKRETDRLDTADKIVAALEGQSVRIGAKVGEEGQLFGSVTALQVAEAVNAKFGTDIDKKRVDLHGAIKKAGEHEASISIYRDIKVTVTIEVVDENSLTPVAEAAVAEASAEGVAEAADADAEAGAEDVVAAEGVVVAEDAVEAAEVIVDAVDEDAVDEAELAVEVESEAAETEIVAEDNTEDVKAETE